MRVTAAIRAAGLAIATIKSQSMGGACRNWRLRIKKVPVAADSARHKIDRRLPAAF